MSASETLSLVTGGAGFIGSHLAERLLSDGGRVRVLDNLSTGRESNLEHLARVAARKGSLEVRRVDLRDEAGVREAARGVEVIYHQAALSSVQRSLDDPVATNDVNVRGTLNLLEAARAERVRRFVLAGSSSVYGDAAELPKRETARPEPLSPYAVTKLVCEHYARVYASLFGVETVTLRYFNVFGPRQDPTSQYAAVIPIFLTRILEGNPPVIYGDGEQSRDFTYVENVVEANLLAARAPNVSGQCMNIACGERYTLNHLVRELASILGTRVEPRYEAPREGDVRHSQADITLAREKLGFRPSVDFRKGLERTVDSFRSGAAAMKGSR